MEIKLKGLLLIFVYKERLPRNDEERDVWCGIWLSLLFLCSETARKRFATQAIFYFTFYASQYVFFLEAWPHTKVSLYIFHLQAFLDTDFLSIKCISFHTFVLNSIEGIYWNYEYAASCTMYLPLLEVAVGRIACEHHESIFLNSRLLLLSLGTWSNSAANYHKKGYFNF